MISVPCTVRCIDFELLKKDKLGRIRYPAYADVKYDGEYCMADTCNGGVLINGYGKARINGPILDELPRDSVIFGELYMGSGYNGDLYALLSNKMGDDLKFVAFDASRLNGTDISAMSFEERRVLLIGALSNLFHVRVSESYYCEDEADVLCAFDGVVAEGYEGIVVKQANQSLHTGTACSWVKLKYTTTADLRIAYIDPSKERIECEMPFNAKRCGVKVMNNVKATLQVGDMVEIQHYGILSGGGLRHPVYLRKRDTNKKVSIDI